MLTLTIINTKGESIRFPLEAQVGAQYSIGRSEECDVSMPEEMHLSRVHCFLSVTKYGITLTDNNSNNGIYEDEQRTAEIFMIPGKMYRIGGCPISISGHDTHSDAPPPPPPPEQTEEDDGWDDGWDTPEEDAWDTPEDKAEAPSEESLHTAAEPEEPAPVDPVSEEPAPEPRTFRLTITKSNGEEAVFPISGLIGTQYSIGRSDECDIALTEEMHLSRVHCFLSITESGISLVDNNSSNGVYEDEERTAEIRMIPGKVYRIGASPVRITEQAEAMLPPPAPEPEEREAQVAQEAQETPQEPSQAGICRTPTKRHRKFVPPPPRKAIVKRPPSRSFYTAAGVLNTETPVQPRKKLRHKYNEQAEKVKRPPSAPATELGLPYDFRLELQLLNTAQTLLEGDLLRFSLTAEEDCRVFLIQYDKNHEATMLVPGVGGATNKLQAGVRQQFPPPSQQCDYELYVEEPYGEDTILAVACTQSCRFEKIWLECLRDTDCLRRPGEVEAKAIEFCNELVNADNMRWAVAVLTVKTGE